MTKQRIGQQQKITGKQRAITSFSVDYPFAMLMMVSVVSFFARFHLFAEMLTHFTWQFTLGWLYVCVAALALRRYKMLLVSLLFCAVYLYQILPFYQQNSITFAQKSDSLSLQVMHYNVQGNNPNQEAIVQWLEQQQPDVVVLQETTHVWEKWVERLKVIYPYQLTHYMSDSYFGAVLLSKYPLADAKIEQIGQKWNYYFSAIVKPDDTHVVQLYAIHAHPPFGSKGAEIRNGQLRDLAAKVQQNKHLPTIVLGDLNVTPYSPHFKDFLSQTGLHNTMLGYGVQNTWPTDLPLWLMGIAIDHVLVSENLTVIGREIGAGLGSDHLPVTVKVRVPQTMLR